MPGMDVVELRKYSVKTIIKLWNKSIVVLFLHKRLIYEK
jgi:hypothetical protein